MSDDQDHSRCGGDAGTERTLDELRGALERLSGDVSALRVDVATLVGRGTPATSPLGDGRETLIEQLQDNLADVASGEVVGALWDEVRQLRSELGTGLVVEPSDALSTSLDALRAEVDGLRSALGDVQTATERAATSEQPHRANVDAVADQVAALRDFVASELDTVRQTVSARVDAAAEATAATVAAAAARPAPAPSADVQAAIDPETIALLRDEIRASGAIGDQVVDALREELKALRRRIAVKTAERVLDEQQLAQIADAVAQRLAEDQAKG